MEVKILTGSIATTRGLLGTVGQVVDVPDAMALNFIKNGLAKRVLKNKKDKDTKKK
jgi:hypothetical protein